MGEKKKEGLNQIGVSVKTPSGILNISSASYKETISATNNRAQYFSELAKRYSIEAREMRDSARYYAEQNSDVTYEYINNIKGNLENRMDNIASELRSSKQDVLIAGDGIDITDNVISNTKELIWSEINGEIEEQEDLQSSLGASRIYDSNILSDSKGYAKVSELKNGSTKTGIDNVKPEDYIIVGNPTITTDGIVSGFSNANYIKSADLTTNDVQKVVIRCIGKYCSGSTNVLWSFNDSSPNFGVDSNKFTLFGFDGNHILDDYVLQENDEFESICELTQNSFNIEVLINGNRYTTSGAVSYTFGAINYLSIGALSNGGFNWDGDIDLNGFRVYINDSLVYQPCLKIPYTEAKTGAKIVDSQYRDRIQDWYEQSGEGNYYTIDEENETFTLPIPDIYGLIEQNKFNNPYSFGDSKYSQIEITNLSWLISNGQRNSGSVYRDYYRWLNDIYAGRKTQGGVIVKSVEDLTATEYDWKIDTSTQEFILPLKTRLIPLAEFNPVRGNGMALGFTNGVDNFAIGGQNLGYQFAGPVSSGYGASASKAFSGLEANAFPYTLGLTTDSSKSGIVVDLSKQLENLYLYFYVGDVVKSQGIIDVATLSNGLATKTDLEQASGAGMPSRRVVNLTLGASGSRYTAPANGWYVINKGAGNVANQPLYINNITKNYSVKNYAPANTNVNFIFPVCKGDVIETVYELTGNTWQFQFLYAEGSN